MLVNFEAQRVHFIDRPHTFDQGLDGTAHTEPTHAVIVGQATIKSDVTGDIRIERRRLHVSTARGAQEAARLEKNRVL